MHVSEIGRDAGGSKGVIANARQPPERVSKTLGRAPFETWRHWAAPRFNQKEVGESRMVRLRGIQHSSIRSDASYHLGPPTAHVMSNPIGEFARRNWPGISSNLSPSHFHK